MTSEELKLVQDSLKSLPEQINHVFDLFKDFDFKNQDYSDVDKIILCGMGGSNLGARIINSVFRDQLKLPIIIHADYDLPGYVDKNTLCIISSYSGTTEETIDNYKKAKDLGAKTVVITSLNEKNKLIDLAKNDNNLYLAFNPEFNPSNQPRLSLGYAIFTLTIFLKKVGLLKIDFEEIEESLLWLKKVGLELSVENSFAEKIAEKLYGRIITLVGPGFLEGNLHTLRNQTCENCKNFTNYLILPDLNHYAMEGLVYPEVNKKDLIFLFFDSNLSLEKISKRSQLTKKVVEKNGIEYLDYSLSGKNKLEQSLEMLQLGQWITFYLSRKNEVNLMEIPWVDWFKAELGN